MSRNLHSPSAYRPTLIRFRSPLAGWMQIVALTVFWLQPLISTHAVYVPDDSGAQPPYYWVPTWNGDTDPGSPDFNDADGNDIPDWRDQFNAAAANGTPIRWRTTKGRITQQSSVVQGGTAAAGFGIQFIQSRFKLATTAVDNNAEKHMVGLWRAPSSPPAWAAKPPRTSSRKCARSGQRSCSASRRRISGKATITSPPGRSLRRWCRA